MRNIILISICFFCLDTFCQTVNKKPIPKNDSIYIGWNTGFNVDDWFGTNVLTNDKDPEGNAMKVTTFRTGTSTADHKANELYVIDKKAVITIRPDGRLMLFSYPYFEGVITMSYVVNDYFTGNGKRGYIYLVIRKGEPIIVNKP